MPRYLLVADEAQSPAGAGEDKTRGEDNPGDESTEPRLGKETTQFIRIGVEVTAEAGECRGLVGTVPVPTEWPEQHVRIEQEDISPSIGEVGYRDLAPGVKQMIVSIPFLRPGEEAHALITFEVTRRDILPPEKTDGLIIPKRPDRQLRIYLAPSPLIESRNPKIRSLARQIAGDQTVAWKKVETIYDWVRDHVEYKNGPIKGALAALRDGTGDCEELTSLFIALCRASDIPARSVWIQGHCYPEFYLEDEQGKGQWFPCQAAGSRAFGEMAEPRPILQKGDNFRDPDRPGEKLRYVSECMVVKGRTKPKVNFIRVAVDQP